jgi:hypothetical protein
MQVCFNHWKFWFHLLHRGLEGNQSPHTLMFGVIGENSWWQRVGNAGLYCCFPDFLLPQITFITADL